MFKCDHCGGTFPAAEARTLEDCPDCLATGVRSPLAFKAFSEVPGRPGPSVERCLEANWALDAVRGTRRSE